MLFSSTYRITGLHYIYGSLALIAAYVFQLSLQIIQLHYSNGCTPLRAGQVC